MNKIDSIGFWTQHFPNLSINSKSTLSNDHIFCSITDGYFKGRLDDLVNPTILLAATIEKLISIDMPVPFIFVFDETWQCFGRLNQVLSQILGSDYKILPDFWAWHIGPGGCGWQPHRERGKKSLAPDGSPLSITVWIPLSESNEQNSCIYLVPINHDKTYNTNDEMNFNSIEQAISLPAKPGDFLIWNHAILHWGSKAGPCQNGPRISMALEFQRGEIQPFNSPLITPSLQLTFEQRLSLIAKQLVQYRHMQPLSLELLDWIQQYIDFNN